MSSLSKRWMSVRPNGLGQCRNNKCALTIQIYSFKFCLSTVACCSASCPDTDVRICRPDYFLPNLWGTAMLQIWPGAASQSRDCIWSSDSTCALELRPNLHRRRNRMEAPMKLQKVVEYINQIKLNKSSNKSFLVHFYFVHLSRDNHRLLLFFFFLRKDCYIKGISNPQGWDRNII